jgi:Tfp pilus assembly protein PilW
VHLLSCMRRTLRNAGLSSCTNSRNTIGDVGASSCISLNLDQAGFEDDARLLNSPLYILSEISEFTRRLMRRPLQSSEVLRTTVYACYVFLSKRISNLHVTFGQSSSVIRTVGSTSCTSNNCWPSSMQQRLSHTPRKSAP